MKRSVFRIATTFFGGSFNIISALVAFDMQVQAIDDELVTADFLSKMEDVNVLHLP